MQKNREKSILKNILCCFCKMRWYTADVAWRTKYKYYLLLLLLVLLLVYITSII